MENTFNQSKATAASCPLKAPEEAREGKREVTESRAAAKEICSCCSRCSLSELGGIFTLKEQQRQAMEAFLSRQHVFVLLSGFSNRAGIQPQVSTFCRSL